MIRGSLKRLSAATAGVVATRLPVHSQNEEYGGCPSNRKEFSQMRSSNFPITKHWHGKLRVRVLKVRRQGVYGQHTVSEYTVDTKLYSNDDKIFTEENNENVVSTDTQKNSVYLVAKRTPVSSPEQFGVDLARHFLNEYQLLHAVEIDVREQIWGRAQIQNDPHDHGFIREAPAQNVANVKLARNQRDEPVVTSGIRGLTVLKTTQSGWEGFLHDRYTLLQDVDDRCMSTEITLDWEYGRNFGSREPDYLSVRKAVEQQVKLGFFGPAKCGVFSHSVQATIYDIGCMILESVPDVGKVSINTPNLHYLPAMLLEGLGEKFEHDVFVPTSEPSGDIFCTVERDGEGRPPVRKSSFEFTPHMDAIKSDIRLALVNLKSNACPMAMRVAWHASGTWDERDGTGGSDGATMRFEPEFSDAANAGLTMMIDMLKPVKDKHPDVSFADIWALAGAAGIEFLGGPSIPFAFGRTDASGTERGCPAMTIPQNGRLPDASQGAQHLRDVFGRQGFTDREIVALSGGHTLGRCHKVRSGYDGPWTDSPLLFDNSYFKNLMDFEWQKRVWDGKEQFEDVATRRLVMLPTDIALKTDPIFSKIAREYADSQEVFFRDFALAFSKLLHNGCKNKPPELCSAPARQSAPLVPKSKSQKSLQSEKAGLEFREYAMHGSTERMKPFAPMTHVDEREGNSGRTALHKASFWGHIQTITYLLDECKANPNVQDLAGDTPLHDAVRFGHALLVDKLLASGADRKIMNKAGKTPADVAVEYGKHAIAAKLG
eukprot:TRINITY_DN3457_c0_g1_i3.p1 TRINITY_DN3457_c0_g1~~TRINITY_DN3457_c0_g1_i3.p1  ORF type:complete len:771 (-),score=127.48 TRINITY_DN3457_c0_g1_i3:255-2567(-)